MKKIIAVICALLLCIPICVSAEDEERNFDGRNGLEFCTVYQDRISTVCEGLGLSEELALKVRGFNIDERSEFKKYPDDNCVGFNVPAGYIRCDKDTNTIMYMDAIVVKFINDELVEDRLSAISATVAISALEYHANVELLNALLSKYISPYDDAIEILDQLIDGSYVMAAGFCGEVFVKSYNYDYYVAYHKYTNDEGDAVAECRMVAKAPGYDFSYFLK